MGEAKERYALINTFTDFNGLETFFLIGAIIGGFFVLIKLVMQFFGGDVDTDIGSDGGIDFDTEHPDSDVGFRALSLQGLSSFFMMFGLVGLALYRQSQMGVVLSIIGAVGAGLASVWVIGKLFRMASQLHSSGTLQTRDAVGSTGIVYLTIPEGGMGLVSINFQNRLREFDATEVNGRKVPTGTPIQVIEVRANILIIETLNK